MNLKKEINNYREIIGFTLVELMVAMTLFVVVVTLTSSVFVQAVRGQRIISERVTAMDNAALVMEQIAREARTGTSFAVENNGKTLAFQNYKNQIVKYSWDGFSVISKKVGAGSSEPLTAQNITISNCNFQIINSTGLPRILVVIKADSPLFKSSVNLQTTVSARLFRYR